jgi:C1A family cysteine protease
MDLSHLTGKMPREAVPQLLPAAFDWRDYGAVTSVKDQGNCGSCYTFGTIGNFESKLLIDGAGTYDFSENHAKECNWKELNNYENPPGSPWGSCDGGNAFMLTSLFSQKGTVLESCDPYVASDVTCNRSCAYQQSVLDFRLISGNAVPSTDVLKQYLYDHGPIITALYADETQGFNLSYTGDYTFNYSAPAGATNHDVLLVGWSNNLPPVPGGSTPADGWIAKNSWGTGFGDNGYFYIAYGAGNIGYDSAFIHDWQTYDTDGDIWYYDEDGWGASFGNGSSTTTWGLAKYIPDSNTNVTRVEFWTTDVTTDVDVYLYDDFNGTSTSDLLASKLNNSFAEAGYHSVALDSPVPVTTGDDVIAVIKFTNSSFGYPVPADENGPIETGRTYISLTGSSDTWVDLSGYDADVAIRLRTSAAPAPAPTVTSITPDSAQNTGTVHITNVAGSNFQSGATVKLTRTGEADINATNVVVISSSQITCDIDLTGAVTGAWDVVVTNPDMQSGTLPGGFTVTASASAPVVDSITPDTGENTEVVTAVVLGSNFETGATCKLAKLGQPDIFDPDPSVINPSTLVCDLDLTGAATGAWHVVVTNPDMQSGTLPNGFTVTSPGGEDYYVYLPVVMRRWPPVPYTPTLDPISNPDGDGNYTITWSTALLADTYELQEDENSAFSSPTVVYSGSGTSKSISGKTPGTYYYRVRGCNSYGCGSWSQTQSVVVQPSGGWTTIKSENFEGAFPNQWEVKDNAATNGRYYWGKRNCRPYAGSYSGWAVGGGDGAGRACGTNYPTYVFGWMIYGPFSLADASDAELNFQLWLNSDKDIDGVFWGASIDGDNFYGTVMRGNSSGWMARSLDLTTVPTLGDLTGESNVWIAFVFISNESITRSEGGYVDNIVLRKYVGAGSASEEVEIPALPAIAREEVMHITLED